MELGIDILTYDHRCIDIKQSAYVVLMQQCSCSSAKVHYNSNCELAQLIHFKSQVSSFEAFDFWHVADTAHCPEVPLWHKSP